MLVLAVWRKGTSAGDIPATPVELVELARIGGHLLGVAGRFSEERVVVLW